MSDVSTFRLYLLRATYLFIVVGLGIQIWPGIVSHPLDVKLMTGVARSMLGAVVLLALVGLRHPLHMLPLLLFEIVWKAIWLLAFALPLWQAGRLDPVTLQSVHECLLGIVLFPLVLPWPHLWRRYVRQGGDRWLPLSVPGTRGGEA